MNYVAVLDGKAYFASHKITLSEKPKEKLSTVILSDDGLSIVVFPFEDIQVIQKTLDSLNINYQVEQLETDPQHSELTKDIHYTSRSEVIDHINGTCPQSQIIPRLMKHLDEKDERINALEKEIKSIKEKGGL